MVARARRRMRPRRRARTARATAWRASGGRADIPDGTYLVDDDGQVRYRVQEGIGSEKAPAPQATLMSLVTKGILTQQLPWGLVLLGVFTVAPHGDHRRARARLRGRHVPAPREHDAHLPGRPRPQARGPAARAREAESDAGPGVLFSSGLVAGGSIMGLARGRAWPPPGLEGVGARLGFGKQALPAAVGFLAFLGVAYLIYRTATQRAARPGRSPSARRMMKIAFIGTHGVGKTTLCYDLAAPSRSRASTSTWSRRSRGCRPLPINRKTSLEAQTWILMTQVAEEIRSARLPRGRGLRPQRARQLRLHGAGLRPPEAVRAVRRRTG